MNQYLVLFSQSAVATHNKMDMLEFSNAMKLQDFISSTEFHIEI